MNQQDEAEYLGHIRYEFDALYVLTEIIQSRKFSEFPLDSFLLECCLLHFRVIWDFFYASNSNGLNVRHILSKQMVPANRPKQPERLKDIRMWVNSTVTHLGLSRIKPERKIEEPTMDDIGTIRKHTEELFSFFMRALTAQQQTTFTDPLVHKFQNYETL